MPMLYYHHDQLWAETPEHFFEQLDHDFDYRTEDIWLSSYPRSGTAWTYEVLYAVLYEGDMAAIQQAQRRERWETGEITSHQSKTNASRLYGIRRWAALDWKSMSTCTREAPRLPLGSLKASRGTVSLQGWAIDEV
jgi:hypothetical protein